MSANLITRIIVAVIFGPLIIAIGYLGGGWLMGLVLLLSTIGIIEFLINSRFKPSSALFWVALVVLCIAALAGGYCAGRMWRR
jgi:CDP-diglyceride synthetase